MTISVLTPDRKIFIGQVNAVTLPGTLGEFQIKERHAPLVSSLVSGKVTLRTEGEYTYYDEQTKQQTPPQTATKAITFEIERGFVEVLNNEISLLVQGVGPLQ